MNKSISQDIVAGLDIGSSKIAICVGQIREGLINVIALGTAPNYGLRKGAINDIESVGRAIYQARSIAEQIAGIPLSEVVVGINGNHVTTSVSKGVIAVSRADGQISPSDMERVLEAAKAIALPPNREIIHVFPKSFIVDGREIVKDPVGMNGIRLEVEAHIIGGSTPAIRSLDKSLFFSELNNAGYVFNPLATARAVLDKQQKELGVALVDIGAGTTGLSIFEEGDLIHAAVLPIGSMHITNDIAIGLRIPIDVAEKIKIDSACALSRMVKDTEYIDLTEYNPADGYTIPRKYISEIAEARLAEIFGLIQEQLQIAGKDGMLPVGIVYTGGGSQVDGLTEASKEYLRLPSQLSSPSVEYTSLVDNIDNPMYSTSIGLMLWGIENLQVKKYTNGEGLDGIFDKAKNIFKQFLP